MTDRKPIIAALEDILVGAVTEDVNAHLASAIDELKKTCATCRKFKQIPASVVSYTWCEEWLDEVDDNGRGFCHRWDEKLTSKDDDLVMP